MQAIAPVTLTQLLGHAQEPRSKLEIYDGSVWVDITNLAGDNYLISLSCQPSGPQIKPEIKLGKWSAQIRNHGDIFSPFHATSTYATLFILGRMVRISLGARYGGTDYLWQRFTGYISSISFEDTKHEISLSGDDFGKRVADFKLSFPNNYWGGLSTFDSVSSTGVTGAEKYTEGDAMATASEGNNVSGWSDVSNCVFTSVADAGGGSTYAGRMVREAAPGVAYVHNADIGSVVVGTQYYFTFKGKRVSGSYAAELRLYQTVSGVLQQLASLTIDTSSYISKGVRFTALKTGTLEARLYWPNGAENNELRFDQISYKIYEASWYRYQLPANCTGPYYVTLGQIAFVENSDVATLSGTTRYRLGFYYSRPVGSGRAWLIAYQSVAGTLTELGRTQLTSIDPSYGQVTFTAVNNAALYVRLVSEDGAASDQIRIDRMALYKADPPIGPNLYAEADAMDTASEANNVTNWSTVTGGTFDSLADASLGSSYVGRFTRTGAAVEQIVQGSRDDEGKFDGWLYDVTLQQFYFDMDRIVEDGTDNLNIYYFTAQSLENVVADILVQAGLYDDRVTALADMVYTASGVTLDRIWFEEGTTAQQALNLICQRLDYRFWFDQAGRPHFVPNSTLADSVVDLALGPDDVSAHSPNQDYSFLINSLSIEGAEQKPFAQTDDQRDTKWTGLLEDATSKKANSIYSLVWANHLFQDQPSLNAMLSAVVAARKDPFWSIVVDIAKCPAPVEIGDTVTWQKTIGADNILFTGVVRDMSLTDKLNNSLTLEVVSYVASSVI
jgi:hypothetical protein